MERTFGCVRFVYNKAKEMRDTSWKVNGVSRNFAQTSAALTEWKRAPDMAWLNEVSAVPLQQALRHLDDAYRRFFQKTAKYPKFRSKSGRQSAQFAQNSFHYKNGVLRLAKLSDPIRVIWSRKLPCCPSMVTVIKETDEKWYVTCRILKEHGKISGGNVIGIDLGLKTFATLSTGEKILQPQNVSHHNKKIARAQKQLSKKKKGSANRNKCRIKVARAYVAAKNSRVDFLHKLSTRLIRENQTICVETLSIKGMLKAGLHSKAISLASWGLFLNQLSYKAVWYGRNLVKISRWHPSTKTCSSCGTTGHAIPLATREWTCPDCLVWHDRDHNAAKNILAEGLSVIACGEAVNPRMSHSRLDSVKQESVS